MRCVIWLSMWLAIENLNEIKGTRLTLFTGINVPGIVNEPRRSNPQQSEYRQQYRPIVMECDRYRRTAVILKYGNILGHLGGSVG